MPGYWWRCEACGNTQTFKNQTGRTSVPAFLRDDLIPAKWKQSLLAQPCGKCGEPGMRIAYEFPRRDKPTIMVVHIVGLPKPNGYLPMMWETYFLSDPDCKLFDFKYVSGRQIWGLNKATVFSQQDLRDIFALYCKVVDVRGFP